MVDAPTVMAEGARAGEVVPASVFELPAATYKNLSDLYRLSQGQETYYDVDSTRSELCSLVLAPEVWVRDSCVQKQRRCPRQWKHHHRD